MTQNRDEAEAADRFRDRYRLPTNEASEAIERRVIGAVWGANGYTTLAQADELARRVDLRAGHRLLDLGAGRGWPGLYLAKVTGCAVALSDLPVEALATALARAGREEMADRCLVAAAGSANQPFRAAAFDAVVHTDVIC